MLHEHGRYDRNILLYLILTCIYKLRRAMLFKRRILPSSSIVMETVRISETPVYFKNEFV
jgi:hypothetical protein